jgi:2',3'-cyclic-nucleotide 2'-phosphodiesterase (5'-nucleotidase family)
MRHTIVSKGALPFVALLLLAASCHTPYHLASIDRTRILIDSRYDAHPDAAAAAFIQPYEHTVDSLMKPVVGRTAEPMIAHRPESNLSNLLSDILVWGGEEFNEKPDFGVYNMGGIRASLPQGDITYGDVLNVAPFENHICFLTLSGEKTLQLFREMAARGGEGVSHSVRMVITKDGKLKSVAINGAPVDPQRSYRIATLDYLAQGNDGLAAFKDKTDAVSPDDEAHDVRYIIVNYFKHLKAQGKAVDTKVEGRVNVE